MGMKQEWVWVCVSPGGWGSFLFQAAGNEKFESPWRMFMLLSWWNFFVGIL